VLDSASFIILCGGIGLLGLDATAALQVMVSRPLVVGALVGWFLGDMAAGLTVGGLIELLWIGGVPVGSLVPPDATIAAAVASTVAVLLAQASLHPGAASAAVSLVVLLAVPAASIGARAEILQRRVMGGLGRRADAAAARGDHAGVGGILLAALGLTWLRGALAMALCLATLLPMAAWMLASFPADVVRALQWSFWLFWLLGLAVAANHFWDRKGLKYAALLLLVLAIVGTRAGISQMQVLLVLVLGMHLLGLWRWWRALRGEATA
jgi:mannose/fructose/N-acetylgalactosamine-specific phosphotransferase system component IIC